MIRSTLAILLLGASAFAAPLPDPMKESDVPKELLKARLNAVREVFRIAKLEAEAGRGQMDDLPVWSLRLLEAERAVAANRDEHLAACRDHLERMKEYDRVQKLRHDAGRASAKELAAATYFRVEAEIILARVEGKK
jgi:hypothetical protein